MTRLRYPFALLLLVTALSIGAVAAYGRISAVSLAADAPPYYAAEPPDDGGPAPPFAPATAAEYAPFAVADSIWRAEHAPLFTLEELQARGDGRRSPREALQDRVYGHTRRGEHRRAIAELESWLVANPRDRDALLSLARLLANVGRTDESARRYRELIAIEERGRP